MRRLLISALLAAASALACECFGADDPCMALDGESVVFQGRVLLDSGEGFGTGPARLLIEEPLRNVKKSEREIEVDTAHGSTCYYRLKAGERYVIVAGRMANQPSRLSMSSCSLTFPLDGNEHILAAIRTPLSKRAPSRLVGKVRLFRSYPGKFSVPAAKVVARSISGRYDYITHSDAAGIYMFHDIAPGLYELEVAKDGFMSSVAYNRRWSLRWVENPATKRLNLVSADPPGSVLIGKNACAVWDLGMWPRGRISGAITGLDGMPMPGVLVQAFAFDRNGKREPGPLRTATTGDNGEYTIEPLPGAEYIVGVNLDGPRPEPYPPTAFSAPGHPGVPARVRVFDSAETPSIHFVLPRPRIPATMHVQVVGTGGLPYAGATLTLETPASAFRWRSREPTPENGGLEVPIYIGAHYIVTAVAVELPGRQLRGTAQVKAAGPNSKVVIVLKEGE